MAFGVDIPYTHTGATVEYIELEYKKSTEQTYTTVRYNPTDNPLKLEQLSDCTTYDIRVRSVCENGQVTAWAGTTINTGNC